MKKYIIKSACKDEYDIYGNWLGIRDERALYYCKEVGRHRIYRSSYPKESYMVNGIDINKNLELLIFTSKKEAKNYCRKVNKVYGDDFEVVTYVEGD